MKSAIYIQRICPGNDSFLKIDDRLFLDDDEEYSDWKERLTSATERIPLKYSEGGIQMGTRLGHFAMVGEYKQIDSVGRNVSFLFYCHSLEYETIKSNLVSYSSELGFELVEGELDKVSIFLQETQEKHKYAILSVGVSAAIASISAISISLNRKKKQKRKRK